MVHFFYNKIGSCVSADFSGSRFLCFFCLHFFRLFSWRGVGEEKRADKMIQKNGTCFLRINPVTKIPQNKMVLFFFVF